MCGIIVDLVKDAAVKTWVCTMEVEAAVDVVETGKCYARRVLVEDTQK